MLLIVRTAMRRYAIRRADISAIRLVSDRAAMPCDERGNSYIGVELGALIDPADRSTLTRWRALAVPMRRRQVALMVDWIEAFDVDAQILALPELLGARLQLPWAIGALPLGDDVVVALDARAVARSVLARPSNDSA